MTIEMKNRLSKVMTPGNKLASSMARSAALVEAWAIVKAGGLTLLVRGVSFGSRQEALQRLTRYQPSQIRTWLAPEPENPADQNAVAVMVTVQGGRGAYRLGSVPREDTGTVKAIAGRFPRVEVIQGTTPGIRLRLAV